MNSQTINVCGLGISLFILFSGFDSLTDLQKTLLSSAHDDNPDFNVDGYTLSGVLYTSFAISVFLAPSVIASLGPRLTMFIGSAFYLVPPVTMLLEETWLLYMAGSLSGVGASLLWTASSNYLVLNSNEQTMARNSALFWFFYRCGMFPGNIFTYFAFKNVTVKIDEATRHLVLYVLTGILGTGCFMVLILIRKVQDNGKEEGASTPWQALKKTWNIALSRNTALLLIAFGYCGLHLSFTTGIYGASIGFTLQLGEGVKRLVPLASILIGCGEVSGGIIVKLFGNINIFRINFFFVLAVMLNCTSYLITYLSLPAEANFGNTYEKAIMEPRIWLLLLAGYIFGIGDSFVNIQLYTLVGCLYPNDSAPAFSVFKILRTAFTATSFYYSRYLPLPTQLLILTIVGTLGMITFNVINIAHERKKTASNS